MNRILCWAWLGLALARLVWAQQPVGTVGPAVTGQIGVYRLELSGEAPTAGEVVEIWHEGQRVGEAFVVPGSGGWRVNLKGVFACRPGDQAIITGRSASGPRSDDRSQTTPDWVQEQAELPGGGTQYCCPAAVANSLQWLSNNGYPALAGQSGLQTMKELGQLMGTDGNGTNLSEMRRGLEAYLGRRQLHGTIDYRGFQQGMGAEPPDLDWLRQGLAPKSVAWLNIGFYQYDSGSDTYTRSGGHWVTLVGCSAEGRVLVHDPARRAGLAPSTHSLRLQEIPTGTLGGSAFEGPLPARGYLKVLEGLVLPRSKPVAVVDGVVHLRMP
jgi:hypothetical protein